MEDSTGDLKNNVMKLLKETRRMKLEIDLDIQGLAGGCPDSLLQLLHTSLMSYSLLLANWLTKHGYDLYCGSDRRFIQELYKVLRDVFSYKPKLSKEQFLTPRGYAERKILLATHVLQFSQAKHAQLTGSCPRTKKSIPRHSNHGNSEYPVPLVVSMETVDSPGNTSPSLLTPDPSSSLIERHVPPFQIEPTMVSSPPPLEVHTGEDVSCQLTGLKEVLEEMSAKLVLLETRLKTESPSLEQREIINVKGALSAETGEGLQSVETVKGLQSAETGEGLQSAETGEGLQSVETMKGLQSAETGEGLQSVETVKGLQSAETGEGLQSAETVKGLQSAETLKGPLSVEEDCHSLPASSSSMAHQSTRELIESLRVRAKKTKEYLQQVNDELIIVATRTET